MEGGQMERYSEVTPPDSTNYMCGDQFNKLFLHIWNIINFTIYHITLNYGIETQGYCKNFKYLLWEWFLLNKTTDSPFKSSYVHLNNFSLSMSQLVWPVYPLISK